MRSCFVPAVLFLLAALSCSGREKKLQEIQDLIQAGNKEEALERIRLELTAENKRHAREVDDGDLTGLMSSPGCAHCALDQERQQACGVQERQAQ
jgi:hypothetical protein